MKRKCPFTLLVVAILALAAPTAGAAEAPFCELYAVGHFGNWYEVAGNNEMPWYKSWANQPPPPAPKPEQ